MADMKNDIVEKNSKDMLAKTKGFWN